MIDGVDIYDEKKFGIFEAILTILGVAIIAALIAIISLTLSKNNTANVVQEKISSYEVYSIGNDIYIKCTTESGAYSFNINSDKIKYLDDYNSFVLDKTYLYLSPNNMEEINKQLENYGITITISKN